MTLTRGSLSKEKKIAIVLGILGGLIIIGGLIGFFVHSIVKNQLVGTIQLDGSEFKVQSCRSGSVFGFSGLQLGDIDNRRIRVIVDPSSGATKVALFNPSQTAGEELGLCAKLEMIPQNSNVNGIKNQRGNVTFSCTNGKHNLTGTMQFKNCH